MEHRNFGYGRAPALCFDIAFYSRIIIMSDNELKIKNDMMIWKRLSDIITTFKFKLWVQ